MSIELIITIIIAAAGWCVAAIEICLKRKWEKKDSLATKRYDAYRKFMDKFDEINSSMKETPETSIFHLTDSFIKTITSGETLDPNRTVAEFSQKLMQQVKSSCEPLQIINSEINSIKLIASDELLEKLEELKDLNTDLYNEMMHSLSLIGGTQLQDFQSLKSVGQQERWKRFTSLHNEIMSLMRKEIGI